MVGYTKKPMKHSAFRMPGTGATIAVALGLLSIARAQAPASPLTFDVASVRPGKPGAVGYGMPKPMPGGQSFIATNSPLMVMLMSTYRITDHQILGAPKWMIYDPWDVNAKAEHPSTPEQLQEMFRTLLADRFNLRFHRETKEGPAYVLSVEKSGSKLKRSEIENPSERPIEQGDRPGERVGTGVSMSYLCWYLSFTLDVPLVDQTGLYGNYDFTLRLPQTQETPGPAPTSVADDLDRRNADLITALREQLGLKLEYRKAPVEVLVIDHVERPTDN